MYACSNGNTGSNCILFNLICKSNQRIQILSASYSFGCRPMANSTDTSTPKSSSEQTKMHKTECDITLWNCSGSTASENCSAKNRDIMKPYESGHMFQLFQKCSLKQSCSPRSEAYRNSVYCRVRYRCITGKYGIIVDLYT